MYFQKILIIEGMNSWATMTFCKRSICNSLRQHPLDLIIQGQFFHHLLGTLQSILFYEFSGTISSPQQLSMQSQNPPCVQWQYPPSNEMLFTACKY